MFQRRKPRRLVWDHLHDQPLDARRLAPIPLEGLKHELDAGRERDEFIGTGTDRRLLERLVADLLDVFLRHDPAGAARIRIEVQKVGPRLFQLEADMLRIGCLDRREIGLHQVVRCAAVAFIGELDVFGGDRLTVVEFGLLPDHEVVGQPVRRRRPRLRQARRLRLARHRLHHRVVQRVQHHERGDDPLRLRRIQPIRRQRDMHAVSQLPARRGRCDARRAGRETGSRGGRENLAPGKIDVRAAETV